MGPTVFALHPKGDSATSITAPMRSWSYTFTVTQKASIRVNLEYDFAHHSFGMLFCKCDKSSGDCNGCVEAYGYYNGLEVPTQELSPGSYIVYVQPWSKSVASGNAADDVYINFCTYVMFQLLVAPVASTTSADAALCSSMMQYLPASLNNVAFLSPYYNDEMHMFQNVLLSKQHMADKTTFKIGETSVLRVMTPAGGIEMALRVVGTDNSFHRTTYSTSAALYLQLEAGSYELQVHFFVAAKTFHDTPCTSVPLELSIMTVEDLTAVAVPDTSCQGSLPFPTKPFFHGHTTLYRKPHDSFNEAIRFSIGELGGTAEFDVRYNFETSGLQVRLVGDISSGDGLVTQKVFPWTFYADRAYLSTSLPHGSYQLQIVDPAQLSGMYADGTKVVSCIAYSLHLRTQDFGNYSHYTPVTSTPAPPGQVTSAPQLQCPFQRIDPFPASFARNDDDRTFAYSSDALSIPFDAGTRVQVNIGQRKVPMMLAKQVINIRSRVTNVFRLWVRSTAKVFMQARLYDNDATVEDDTETAIGSDGALMTSSSWGYHTQTLYFPVHRLSTNEDDTEDTSIADMRLEILFYYREAPKYNTDYNNCNEKKRLTTFELYSALFDEEDAIVGCQCTSSLTSMTAAQRLPPRMTVLGPSVTTVSGTYNFTQDERVRGGSKGKHNGGNTNRAVTIPPKPSYAPSDPFSDNAAPRDPARRELEPLAVGNIPGVSDEVRAEVDIVFNTSFVVPSNAKGVRIMSHTKYPLNFINLRTALYGDNQTDALQEGLGSPMIASDGMYQAESLIELTAKTLGPGTYTIVFMVDNAVPFHKHQVFCVPFHWSLRITAEVYPGASPIPPGPTPAPKPKLLDIFPTNARGLDRTDPLMITFVLSEDATMSLNHAQPIGKLQRDDNGVQIAPSAQYFADTDRLIILFGVAELEWGVSYHLVLDALGLKTANGLTYDISSFASQRMTYSTATCGCVGGYCAPGGSCQCVESGGERCDTCTKGYSLGAKAKTIGVGTLAAHLRICEEDVETPASDSPSSPTAAPQGTPTPTTRRVTPAPTPAPDEGRDETPTPENTLPPDTPQQQPPLRMLRYVLAYGALIVVITYSILFVFRHRKRARHTLLARNPFHRSGQSGGLGANNRFGTTIHDADEEGEDEDESYNLPSVR